MEYKEQLQDKRWYELREKILNNHSRRCAGCGNPDGLNVHHKTYIKGLMAWEYDEKYLIPLCHDCHEIFHRNERALREILCNNRLYYNYEFKTIIKIVEAICSAGTNHYPEILEFAESKIYKF